MIAHTSSGIHDLDRCLASANALAPDLMTAAEVEAAVVNQIRILLRSPEIIVRTWRAAYLDDEQIDEPEVAEALRRLDPLWDQLFPAEQARILQLLVARVVVRLDGLEISLRVEGITSVVEDLRLRASTERQAA